MTFIKSATTSTSVGNSRSEVEKILRRYGASGIAVQQAFDTNALPEAVTVSFIIPDKPGSEHKVPVSLPVNVKRVYDGLFGEPKTRTWQGDLGYITVHNPKGYDAKKMQQAERVAWRNLVLWIDAALSAAAVGLQTITEAFYAHTVVQLDTGGTARLAEVIERMQGNLPSGVRALLASPAEIE